MRRQSGFGMFAVIALLVILAVLAGGVVALSSTQSSNLAQDARSANAEQAARAGTEWGLFQAFSTAGTAAPWCDNATTAAPAQGNVNLPSGFQVAVTCWANVYREGQEVDPANAPALRNRVIRVYQVTAIACPLGGACPANGAAAAASNYVERRREAVGF